MKFSRPKNTTFFKIIFNKYIIIFIVFLIWMLFFDENSYLTHRKFNKEIQELKNTTNFYKKKIKKDKKKIQQLQNPLELERFAREQYLMKKENEDIYIIEFDTIKK